MQWSTDVADMSQQEALVAGAHIGVDIHVVKVPGVNYRPYFYAVDIGDGLIIQPKYRRWAHDGPYVTRAGLKHAASVLGLLREDGRKVWLGDTADKPEE